jgi:TrkA-N domain/RyR domain
VIPKTLRRWYSEYKWVTLGAATIAVFILGMIGSAQHAPTANVFDVVYYSLRLFKLSGPEGPGLPLALEVARFLAPLVTGSAGIVAVATLFRDRAMQARIPWMRRHVVVCGLGYVGSAFVRQLRAAGFGVVVIEREATNPLIDVCRRSGVPVVIGDAALERSLYAAGVYRAARLLAVCPDDAVNTEVVAVARQISGRRSGIPLRCLARIGNADLAALLRVQEANVPEGTSTLDYFNTDEVSARLMLDANPSHRADGSTPHILVSRLESLNEWLILHAARDWYATRADAGVPMWVTVVDDDANERVSALVSQNPDLADVCRFVCCSEAFRDIAALPEHHRSVAAPPLTRGYLSGTVDERALESALTLRHALSTDLALVLALSRSEGVSHLVSDARDVGALRDVVVFSTLTSTCTVDLVQGGSLERIAETIHRRWCARQTQESGAPPSWEALDDTLRESNRAQARDIFAKVHRIGCEIGPIVDWRAPGFEFTDAEVESLAIDEHERWIAERRAAGWLPGPKDTANRRTPYLVPFGELADDIADFDRNAVRDIPSILASAGLQIERRRPGHPALTT